jgi:ribosome-associated toxin RatA of RatAB toxin-antitoxin module
MLFGVAEFSLLMGGAALGSDLEVKAEHEGNVFVVQASAAMQVPLELAWQVITDYNHLGQFIPDMTESRVVQRDGQKVVVAQTGTVRFLVFSRSIQVTLEVDEVPFERVTSRAVSGDFKEMNGRYVLEQQGTEVKLHYEGRIVPDFFVPPLLGTLVVRRVMEGQFRAMVQEIIRRSESVH